MTDFIKKIYGATYVTFEEVINDPAFKEWVKEETSKNGSTLTDEEYCTRDDVSELSAALGTRLSWISPIIGLDEEFISDNDKQIYAGKIILDETPYWVVTLLGDSSLTWICNEEGYQDLCKTKKR